MSSAKDFYIEGNYASDKTVVVFTVALSDQSDPGSALVKRETSRTLGRSSDLNTVTPDPRRRIPDSGAAMATPSSSGAGPRISLFEKQAGATRVSSISDDDTPSPGRARKKARTSKVAASHIRRTRVARAAAASDSTSRVDSNVPPIPGDAGHTEHLRDYAARLVYLASYQEELRRLLTDRSTFDDYLECVDAPDEVTILLTKLHASLTMTLRAIDLSLNMAEAVRQKGKKNDETDGDARTTDEEL